MSNNHILDIEIKTDDDITECVHEYIYLGQKIGAFPDHEKKSKEEMRWEGVLLVNNTML